MKRVIAKPLYIAGFKALLARGFDPERHLNPLQEQLEKGKPIPDNYRDHALKRPLTGYRACHVGTHQGQNLVLIYRDSGRRISWEALDEHDAAYRALESEVTAQH